MRRGFPDSTSPVERDHRVMRVSRILFIGTLIVGALVAVPALGTSNNAEAAPLPPTQRMCSSPNVPTVPVPDFNLVTAAACTLSFPTNGTVYVTASASVGMATNVATAAVQSYLFVDDAQIQTSGRLVDVRADTGDGSARNLYVQDVVDLDAGTHTFKLRARRYFGTGAPRLLDPAVSVLFVPESSSDVLACSSRVVNIDFPVPAGDVEDVASCSVEVPTSGLLVVAAGAQLEHDNTVVGRVKTVLRIDGSDSPASSPDFWTTSTANDKPRVTIGQQATKEVTSGSHTVVLAALATTANAFTLLWSTIRAIFIPTASAETGSCSADAANIESTTNTTADVVSCSVTLPRAGSIQIQAGGNVFGATFPYEVKFTLAQAGTPLLDTERYMNLYGDYYENTANTFVTQTQRDLPAGTYAFTLRLQPFTAGASIQLSVGWINVIATYAAPDDAAPPTTPVTTAATTPPTTPPAAIGGVTDFVPLVPERVLDTRLQSQVGYTGPKPTAGQVVEAQVTASGTSNVPRDAKAVVLNLTGSEAMTDGYVTAWPCGSPQPTASNLNVKAGSNVPNLVISKVGDGGKVCLFTQPSQHLIADLAGYMPSDSRYVPVVPERFLDTRAATRVGYDGAKPTADQTVQLHVTGVGAANVPADAAAVVLNVTGTEAASDGYITAWPCGAPRPLASNLNLVAGTDRPNLVISKIGDNGNVCLYTQNGAHLVADINGYLPAGTSYSPLVPTRVLETRPTTIGYTGDKPGPGTIVRLHVVGTGTPAVPANATAVVLNVTGTDATADGYVTIWPCGATQPTASNLNLTAGSTAPNLVISKIGDGGDICLYTQSGTHLVADLAGYWAA